jgi:hypothetical protein
MDEKSLGNGPRWDAREATFGPDLDFLRIYRLLDTMGDRVAVADLDAGVPESTRAYLTLLASCRTSEVLSTYFACQPSAN